MNAEQRQGDHKRTSQIPPAVWIGGGVGLALIVLLAITHRRGANQVLNETLLDQSAAAKPSTPATNSSSPAPPARPNPFENASAQYIGAEACKQCHPREYESYKATPHSKALDRIDLQAEPPDTELFHQLSGRWYRVYRQDGKMRHREFIKTDSGEEVVLADYAMDYVIGSGNHSRSYLFEADGFLMESPVTWFAAKKDWDMSPGYEDNPQQQGFARGARFECIACHAGHVEILQESTHRLKVHEMAIGCERCHGPGSLHAARWRDKGHNLTKDLVENGGGDMSIVHPGRLDRQQLDDICAQCHLATAALVNVRGRDLSQFRPGAALTDYLLSYIANSSDRSMTVTGHVEQMRMSRCYTQSDSLTCVSCHDPHHGDLYTASPQQRVEYYRNRCLSCHETDSCGLSHKKRLAKSPQDNCVTCHMPTADTDITHFAFTHHRIGVDHQKTAPQNQIRGGDKARLAPLFDVSHLPPLDRQRSLGLAYLMASNQADPPTAQSMTRRGAALLESVKKRGIADPEIDATLAKVYRRQNPKKAIELATKALSGDQVSPNVRLDALFTLGTVYFEAEDYHRAIDYLQKLVQVQRRGDSWMMLALSHARSDDIPSALRQAHKAAEIEPDRPDIQDVLYELYTAQGQAEKAQLHRKRAEQLRRIRDSSNK